MVNGLGVLGWGVGGIEAEAAMLGQPISMLIPEVVGFRLIGKLKEGATATDLVLTVTQMLRRRGVVGRFVEYCGPGRRRTGAGRPRDDRQHGAGIRRDLRLLPDRRRDDPLSDASPRATRRGSSWSRPMPRRRACGATPNTPDPVFTDLLELDLGTVEPSLAGPRRPQDRVSLSGAAAAFDTELPKLTNGVAKPRAVKVAGTNYELHDGDVVIAAITSCTNTSNPSVMLAAGLLAKKAVEKGLKVKPWVKTSLAPGSQVVSDYYAAAGLQEYLDKRRLQPGRLRLHDLHRQFRAAARADVGSDRRRRPGRSAPCCRATAISRAASMPRCAPTTWPRRRWSSPMRWPARSGTI